MDRKSQDETTAATTSEGDVLQSNKVGQRDVKRAIDSSKALSQPSASKVQKFSPITINSLFLDDALVSNLKQKWESNEDVDIASEIKVYNDPFKICVLNDFLKDPKCIDELVNEMSVAKWNRRQMDLYEFHNTNDLITSNDTFLKLFYENLKNNVMPWMQQFCKETLTSVSATCSMYNAGDHLLVHDDLLGDRQIAYVFYLTPWTDHKEWSADMGGALELFGSDENGEPVYPVLKQIFPKNNQFVFFRVCSESFHQVGEVTNFSYPRLTINGWFHGGNGKELEISKLNKIISEEYQLQNGQKVDLTNWILEDYLKDKIKYSIQDHIEEKSEASLEDFLLPETFSRCTDELKNTKKTQWMRQGPAHYRNYEKLKTDSLENSLKDLVDMFSSEEMFKLLHAYTDLDLYGANMKQPTCFIEIYRMTHGCYSLLGDPLGYADNSLDVILYFNAKENVGVITYLNPDENSSDSGHRNASDSESYDEDDDVEGKDDAVLLTVYPKNNALNLVYRSEGTAKFIKYISKNSASVNDNEFVYILLASFKE